MDHTDWPFFADEHRRLARDAEAWARANIVHDEAPDTDAACRALVRQLGDAGWLRYCVKAEYGGALAEFDARAICLLRETLAYHAGLADFAFAMQGPGSG